MSNKKITDLTELTNPTTDDVFPIVDIATNTTQKVQVGNLPIQTAVTTALATKQATLVSGTNIKTVNGNSVLGSGDINIPLTPPSGVSGAIQFSTGSAFASDASNLFWDDTNNRLGIGTNMPTGKTQITESFTTTGNNYSAITFDGTLTSRATASDTIFGFRNTQSIVSTALSQTIIANDLTPNYTFFDANTDSVALRIGGLKNTQNNISAILMQQTATAGNNGLAIQPANSRWQMGFCAGQTNSMGNNPRVVFGASGIRISTNSTPANNLFEIIGTGSTSATTSLLVQNSSGTEVMKVRDDGFVLINNTMAFTSADYGSLGLFAAGVWTFNGGGINDTPRINWGGYTSSFPSLKRSTTNLQVRLADDSGYAPIDASLYKVSGTNGFTGTGSYTNFTIVGGIITNAS